MSRGEELAAERIDPIARLAQETDFVALIVAADRAAVLGHVRGLEGLTVVKHGRVESTMKIGIGFDEKMVGENPPAVTEQDGQKIGGLSAVSLPILEPEIQMRGKAKAEDEKSDHGEAGNAK